MRAIVSGWLLLAALLLSSCGMSDDTPTYRYRLTVEVDTPEGLKAGSSVIEVDTSVAGKFSIPTPGAVRFRARGEAVAVDLPDGRTLFALLRSENEADWAGNIMFLLAPKYRGEDAVAQTTRAITRNRREQVLPIVKPVGGGMKRDGYPMLVTFGDIEDPTTVERVEPLDLAATFGEGVSLKRITVQVTDDTVTTGIEKRLGWLAEVRGALVHLPIGDYPPSGTPLPLHHTLTKSDFRKGA